MFRIILKGLNHQKVEENNFYNRKRLHQYNNIMNQYRELIYSIRKMLCSLTGFPYILILTLLYQTIKESIELDKHLKTSILD